MFLVLWCSLTMSVIAPFAEAGWNAQIGCWWCWWRRRNYRYRVWAKGKHDSTLSPVASLSQTLAVFFSKDLWAGSVVKVHHLSTGKSAEHDWIIWFSISEDWWVMFSEGHDNSSGKGVTNGFQKMPYLSSQGFQGHVCTKCRPFVCVQINARLPWWGWPQNIFSTFCLVVH